MHFFILDYMLHYTVTKGRGVKKQVKFVFDLITYTTIFPY